MEKLKTLFVAGGVIAWCIACFLALLPTWLLLVPVVIVLLYEEEKGRLWQ